MISKWEMASCIIILWNTRVKRKRVLDQTNIFKIRKNSHIFCEIRSEVFNESKEVHV